MRKKRILTPLILITAGIMLLAQNLNIIDNIFSKGWPIFLILIGISKLFKTRK